MAKKELKMRAVVAPTETVIVSAYDKDGKADACTLAFYMVSSHVPPCVTIGINATQKRKTLKDMLETKAFVLGFPSVSQVKEADYLGVESGYQTDKLANIGFTTSPAETVYAPIINELALSLECEVIHTVTVGSHMQVTGEVKRIIADESILNERGRVVLEKLQPIIYDEEAGRYLSVGEKVADAFRSGIELKEHWRLKNMAKKIVAVNAGPRKGWNTDTLIDEAIKGAESAGAEVQKFDLFRLEKYTGCVSCFGCKKEKNKGHCVCRDGLTPVLDAIREADGLIIGSPNYLGELTASFRALYERLVFQNLTYSMDPMCCNENMIPVLLIMTSNAPDSAYQPLLKNYQQTFNRFVGSTEVFVSGDTLQIKDYSKTDWPWYFDAEAKQKRHETVFPREREKAFELGTAIAKKL